MSGLLQVLAGNIEAFQLVVVVDPEVEEYSVFKANCWCTVSDFSRVRGVHWAKRNGNIVFRLYPFQAFGEVIAVSVAQGVNDSSDGGWRFGHRSAASHSREAREDSDERIRERIFALQ